jgi:hypothetical protein
VNGSDPELIRLINKYKAIHGVSDSDAYEQHRFQDNNQLKFSLRSIEKFAPWARHIIIVTNGQTPAWLNLSHPKIRLVTHEQIFPDKSHLPTFNSLAIESHLHRIPGLSRRFIYFNDDILLGKPVTIEDFYTPTSGFKIRLGMYVPRCTLTCPGSWLGDGYCDDQCNVESCKYDNGDCKFPESDNLFKYIFKSVFSGILGLSSSKSPVKRKIFLNSNENSSHSGSIFNHLYEDFYTFLNWAAQQGFIKHGDIKLKLKRLYETILAEEADPYLRSLNKNRSYDEFNTKFLFDFLFQNHADRFFSQSDRRVLVDEFLKLLNQPQENMFVQFKKRKLLEVYTETILHNDKLLNRMYGHTLRRVPVHAPLLIDIEIMKELQEKLGPEFHRTSSNRFRTSNDLQYAFVYHYFITNEMDRLSSSSVLEEIDLNKNRIFDAEEILMVKLKMLSLNRNISHRQLSFNEFKLCFKDFSASVFPKRYVLKCKQLLNSLRDIFSYDAYGVMRPRHKYKFEIINGELDTLFVTIGGPKQSYIRHVLEEFAKQPLKFICLNDNMEYQLKRQTSRLKNIVGAFYTNFLPHKSSFEI